MAQDIFKVTVELEVASPEYEMTSCKQWDNHFHRNKELKDKIINAVSEQLSAVLPMIIVDGEKFETTMGNGISIKVRDIEVTKDEQAILDEEYQQMDLSWDKFHDELARRMQADDLKGGVYSMGDLSGPISQLDEIVYEGKARVAITDGWGDDEPVYSGTVIENPTNWDMFKMFSEALTASNDRHHVFLEGIKYYGRDEDGNAVFQALTGS